MDPLLSLVPTSGDPDPVMDPLLSPVPTSGDPDPPMAGDPTSGDPDPAMDPLLSPVPMSGDPDPQMAGEPMLYPDKKDGSSLILMLFTVFITSLLIVEMNYIRSIFPPFCF